MRVWPLFLLLMATAPTAPARHPTIANAAAGQLCYASNAEGTEISCDVAVGNAGQCLQGDGSGAPVWGDCGGAGGASGLDYAGVAAAVMGGF